MSQHGFTELPHSYVHGTRPIFIPGVFWGHNRIPYQLASTFRPGSLVIELIPQIENDKRQVKQAHAQREATLDQDLEHAIASEVGSLAGLGEVQALELTIAAVNQLQAQLGPRLDAVRQQANRFFGTDPEHRSFHEFLNASGTQADPRQAWLESYRAAFEVKYLEQQHSLLIKRQHLLRSQLSSAKTREKSNEAIARALDKVEQAIVRTLTAHHELQMATSTIQRVLTAFERHQHEDIAEETALEHSHELERETSDLLKMREHLRATVSNKRSIADWHRRLACSTSTGSFMAPQPLKLTGRKPLT